eukprot:TRINITY_DN245069_c1_g1_i1.p1 TRINITY_DN245069_c1_g1~~TRINITY_DN245069_c1_g1_i1.p1  ORF type:complete len:133 (-),score=24.17 TRINITY_DN245069_c1_g1_i1:175-573(-)
MEQIPGAAAFCVVNASNQPLWISSADFHLQMMSFIAFDFIETLSKTTRDSFLGMMTQIEDYRIWGYRTSSSISFILVLKGVDPRPEEVRQSFKAVHEAYVDSVAKNVFAKPNSKIESVHFAKKIEKLYGLEI